MHILQYLYNIVLTYVRNLLIMFQVLKNFIILLKALNNEKKGI